MVSVPDERCPLRNAAPPRERSWPDVGGWSGFSVPHCGVEDRPEMDDPPEQEPPQNGRRAKKQGSPDKPALNKLAQSGNKKTRQRSNDIAC